MTCLAVYSIALCVGYLRMWSVGTILEGHPQGLSLECTTVKKTGNVAFDSLPETSDMSSSNT